MSFELWIAFVIASAGLLMIPGPTVMLVVSYALGRGRGTGWATVPGVALGDFTAMTVSLAGAGAVLAASAALFTVLKFAGAVYLIWLGVCLWRAKPRATDLEGAAPKNSKQAMFWNAYAVTALNPKGIVFFVAFVPQFIDPSRDALPQFMILEATFVTLAFINTAMWAVLAGELSTRFKSARALRWANRVGGGFLIAAGLLTATMRRGA